MSTQVLKIIDDNLILRKAVREDAPALAKFNMEIHGEDDWERKGLQEWTLDLMEGNHPTTRAADFMLIEDKKTGEIISSSCLISQTWNYEGVPFKVGRPELIATREDYRRSGLVREQMKILHEWSQSRGELVQAITGIPYYYRQFGYEMTLDLMGGRSGSEKDLPKLKEGEKEPCSFRLAGREDLAFLKETYLNGCQRFMVAADWDDRLWEYELTGKRQYNINRREIYIIEDSDHQAQGFIGIPPIKWGQSSTATLYELIPGASWTDVTPSVLRFLWRKGETMAVEQGEKQTTVGLSLGGDHPAYKVLTSKLPKKQPPFTFFMRVPDMVAFLNQIKPVLEQRLKGSPFNAHSGKIQINFYRDGVELDFTNGKLMGIRNVACLDPDSATGNFPLQTFLHLLFGHRSMDELQHIYTDCYAKNEEGKHIINNLFPKKLSYLWPIG